MQWLVLILALESGMLGTVPKDEYWWVEPPLREFYSATDIGVEIGELVSVGGTARIVGRQLIDPIYLQPNTTEGRVEFDFWMGAELEGFSVWYSHKWLEREQRDEVAIRWERQR